ncbi:hypothetical protein CMV_009425, partial [Castanea mollissima]
SCLFLTVPAALSSPLDEDKEEVAVELDDDDCADDFTGFVEGSGRIDGLKGENKVKCSVLICNAAFKHISQFCFPFFITKHCFSSLAAFSKSIMEANRGQNGIQQLLAAEQEAQQIVNASKNAKLARLKQAKEEGDKDIAEFRAQIEREFQRKVAESSGDSGANVKRLEQETETKIHHLKTEAARISYDVVQMLLKQVTTVKN